MDNEVLKQVLEDHKTWVLGEGGKRAVLRGAVLRGADLRGADLRGAVLRGAVLRGAVLRGADLRGADLRWTDLRWTDLRGAVLEKTSILQLGPIGSRNDYLIVKRFEDGSSEAMTGCFRGTLDEFEQAVEVTHKEHPKSLREYRSAIRFCREIWEGIE